MLTFCHIYIYLPSHSILACLILRIIIIVCGGKDVWWMCVCVCLCAFEYGILVYMCHSRQIWTKEQLSRVTSLFLPRWNSLSCFSHTAHVRLAGPWACSTLHVYVESCITRACYCIWLFYVGFNNGTHGSRLQGIGILPAEPSHWPYFFVFYTSW